MTRWLCLIVVLAQFSANYGPNLVRKKIGGEGELLKHLRNSGF